MRLKEGRTIRFTGNSAMAGQSVILYTCTDCSAKWSRDMDRKDPHAIWEIRG
jgi:photosystem II stability/assembly factor-like uncharacterized protein